MEKPNQSFRDVYYRLSTDPARNYQKLAKVRIIGRLKISPGTFHNYLSGKHRVPAASQEVIREVLRQYIGDEASSSITFPVIGKEVQNA